MNMYMFISTENGVFVNVPIAGHVIKAYSLENAIVTLQKLFPTRNYTLAGHSTLDNFVEGCKIPLQAMTTVERIIEKPIEPLRQKQEVYAELLTDLKKAGDIMFTIKKEKEIWEKVLGKIVT